MHTTSVLIKGFRQLTAALGFSGFLTCLIASVSLAQPAVPIIGQVPSDNAKTTWIVLRHAERNGKLDELSAQGQRRSEQVKQLGELLNVSAIYTTNFQRTRNTVSPLAAELKIEPIEYSDITESWLSSIQEKHRGQTVLIVGHSNTAGIIAGKLAKTEGRMLKEDEYNAIFLVTTTPDSPPHYIELRFGD